MFKFNLPFKRKAQAISPAKAQAVIFDLDNTLEDFATAEAIAEATLAENVAKEIRCKPLEFLSAFTEVKKRYNHGKDVMAYSRLHWIEDTARLLHLKLDAEELEREYWQIMKKDIKLYPGALSTLKALKSKGIKLGMISDSDGIKGLKRKRIQQLGLEPYFDVIITSDDTGENKPSLKGFHMALAFLKVPATQCVMVGDHPEFDLVPAKQLGMKTVWTQERIMLDRDFPFVDYKIRKIEELLDLPFL